MHIQFVHGGLSSGHSLTALSGNECYRMTKRSSSLRGRGNARVRTPLLILAYLGGIEDFPGDEPGEARLRASEGDYMARMHRRIKDRIKQIQIGYQYLRRGSFTTLVNHLKKLRLVEETERQEDPQERGAGVLGVPGGFMPRTWVRLTPGCWTGLSGMTLSATSLKYIRTSGKLLRDHQETKNQET